MPGTPTARVSRLISEEYIYIYMLRLSRSIVVAVCENSSVVTIYGNAQESNVSKWEKKHILEGEEKFL